MAQETLSHLLGLFFSLFLCVIQAIAVIVVIIIACYRYL